MNEEERQALRSSLQTTEGDLFLLKQGKLRGLPEVRNVLSLHDCLPGKPAEVSTFFQLVVDNDVDREIGSCSLRRIKRSMNHTLSLLDYYLANPDVTISEIATNISMNNGTLHSRFKNIKLFLHNQLIAKGIDTMDIPPLGLSQKRGSHASKRRVNFPITY